MEYAEALKIVLDLARSAVAEPDEEPEANAQHLEAIQIVEDNALYGDI